MVKEQTYPLCYVLSYLTADYQHRWDYIILRAIAAGNNVYRYTGFTPNAVHTRPGPEVTVHFALMPR